MQSIPMVFNKRRWLLLAPLLASAWPVALFAQQNTATSEEGIVSNDIVVLGERIKGGVETKIKPIEEISEKDIAGLGASSITDVLAAVAPQAGSGRGRGGGMPIILLNGQRISGFRELRDLPPEAIKRVQIFPEELALKYGFRPDQRVINFILKDDFSSFNAEIEHAVPDQGGFSSTQWSNGFTRIGATERININVELEHTDRLLESRRDIISASAALPFRLANGSNDVSSYRSLLPATERFEVNTTYSKAFAPQTIGSLNVNFRHDDASSLLGLPSASILVPATSPFAQSATVVSLNRYFTQPRALTRKSASDTMQLGSSFNTLFGEWRLAFTGDYSNVKNRSRTDRRIDIAVLQEEGVVAGSINPYARNFGDELLLGQQDLSESLNQNLNLRATMSGTLLTLPAGNIQVTVRAGFNRQTLDSETQRRSVLTATNLGRSDMNAAISVEVPLLARGPLGEVLINGNFGQNDVSDFGRLTEYGAGIQWKPVRELSLSASIIGDENAPGIGSLGNPVLVTPNVAVYDFKLGQSVFIDQVSGGNPNLLSERRRDFKLGGNWSPKAFEGLSLQIEYFRNSSTNTSAAFPLLTPEIEAAFPGRVVRDGSGQLRSIDLRPINYARERSQRVRFGLNFSGSIGPQPAGFGGSFGGGAGGGSGGGGKKRAGVAPSEAPPVIKPAQPASAIPATGAPPRGRGGGFGAGMLPGGGRQPSRWQISLYDTWTLTDTALIRDGLPVLDRLNGTAVDQNGATPAHAIELAGGVFHKGLGVRISGNYRNATRVTGNAASGSGDLRFGDLATINTNFFFDLDSRGDLTKRIKILKGGRLALRIENILGDVINVRDANGNVPISYQPGYLDPRGRVFELSFRKRF
jgi:iron complex outermembrane recepter protein